MVDSITRSGVLVSAWEAIDTRRQDASKQDAAKDESLAINALAVHSQGVWLLAGLESGVIVLYTLRHDEGLPVFYFSRHSRPISCLVEISFVMFLGWKSLF